MLKNDQHNWISLQKKMLRRTFVCRYVNKPLTTLPLATREHKKLMYLEKYYCTISLDSQIFTKSFIYFCCKLCLQNVGIFICMPSIFCVMWLKLNKKLILFKSMNSSNFFLELIFYLDLKGCVKKKPPPQPKSL